MSLKIKFARKVFAQRTKMGYTQEQLAEAVFASTRWVQNIEKGESLPGGEIMINLLLFLDIDVNDFREDAKINEPIRNVHGRTR